MQYDGSRFEQTIATFAFMLQQKSALQNTLYEQDFHAWTQQQIELLKTQHWQDLDVENVIEEIASLGRQQQQELRNRLSILLAHLLKWEFQSQKRSRSWLATIRIQRIDIMDLLIDNPSLKPYVAEAIARAYRKSISIAVQETDLPNQTFPRECPYLFDDILADDFYPGEDSELIDE